MASAHPTTTVATTDTADATKDRTAPTATHMETMPPIQINARAITFDIRIMGMLSWENPAKC